MDFEVSISCNYISDISKENLIKNKISFNKGWDSNRIKKNIYFVVLGSNIEKNNPELIIAKSLHVQILSFTQFINYFSKEKTRVLIGGTYGKTSIISIILHVLNYHNFSVDYVINKKVLELSSLVNLSNENDFIIIEGNENIIFEMNSELKPQFHNPHIALITSVFWKYVDRFPSFEDYKNYFSLLINNIIPGGILIYNENDNETNSLVEKSNHTIRKESYSKPKNDILNGVVNLQTNEGNYPLNDFNDYSLINIGGALWVCQLMGIHEDDFCEAIISYKVD
jgi:UDP-N-acetylmuramate: L-alanyl-gamma-D-glutamyl-meso-diaminopimelate ligase